MIESSEIPSLRIRTSILSAPVFRSMQPTLEIPSLLTSPRVQVYPTVDGVVLLIGLTIEGKWVAEYRCLAEDFDERCVRAMERRVIQKERRHGLKLVTRDD